MCHLCDCEVRGNHWAHFQTTGTVVGDDGKEVAVTMVQMVEKFEKSCKVKLHIVSRSVR